MGFEVVPALIGAGLGLATSDGDLGAALLGGALGGFGGGLFGAEAGGLTAAEMLAADNAALAGMGFSGAEIASGMAGLEGATAGSLGGALSSGAQSMAGAGDSFFGALSPLEQVGPMSMMPGAQPAAMSFPGGASVTTAIPTAVSTAMVDPMTVIGEEMMSSPLQTMKHLGNSVYDFARDASNSPLAKLMNTANSAYSLGDRVFDFSGNQADAKDAYAKQMALMDAQLAAYQQGGMQGGFQPTQSFGYRNFNPYYGKV